MDRLFTVILIILAMGVIGICAYKFIMTIRSQIKVESQAVVSEQVHDHSHGDSCCHD